MADQQHDDHVNEIIAAYMEAEQTGTAPPQQELLRQYPDLADELRSFFTNREQFQQFAGPAIPQDADTLAPDAAPLYAPGTKIRYFGDYEIHDEIARGGMGVVYRARQVSVNRNVALKMILAGHLAGDSDVQRFHAEAEAAANLDHPNIVPIYEVGQYENQHYFSMKLIDGWSLGEVISHPGGEDENPLQTPQHRVEMLVTVARAVHHAHQRGILHRDLKPGNILIDKDGQPHVTDFGLAKKIEGGDGLTQSGAIVGTPAYMAPEQARGEKVLSTAVDVYSLGAILYELLTGKPPFQAETPLDIVLQVLEKEPVPPRSHSPHANADLETICLKCLSKEPARRYDSAQNLAEDLERWLRGEPIAARPVGNVERTWKWIKRRPAAAALIGVSALAGMMILIGSLIANALIAAKQGETADALQKMNAAFQELSEEQQKTKQALQREEQTAYYRGVALAQREWQAGNVQQAEKILDACPGRFRSWEWNYLKRLCHSELLTIRQNDKGIVAMAFSRDGYRLLSINAANELSVTNSWTGDVIATHTLAKSKSPRAAFSPDRAQLAWSGNDFTIHIIDVSSGKTLRTLTGHKEKMYAIAYRPDGKRVAALSSHGKVLIWDAATGKEVKRFHAKGANDHALCYDAIGGRLLTATGSLGDRGDVVVWDALTGKKIQTLDGHLNPVFAVAVSPNGKYFASVGMDRTLRLWDSMTYRQLHVIHIEAELATQVKFSPDSRWVLAAGIVDKVLVAFETDTGKVAFRLRGHPATVYPLAFSADGRRLASASQVPGAHEQMEIKIWEVARGLSSDDLAPINRQQFDVVNIGGSQIRYSPDGMKLALVPPLGDQGEIRHGLHGQLSLLLPRCKNELTSIVFSPDGRYLLSASGELVTFNGEKAKPGELKLLDAKSGKVIRSYQGHSGVIDRVCFRADGEQFASVSRDKTVRVWDTKSGKVLHVLRGHTDAVISVAWSPNSKFLISGGEGKNICVWNAVSGKLIQKLGGHNFPVRCLNFDPNGRRFVSVTGPSPQTSVVRVPGQRDFCKVRIWETGTWRALAQFSSIGEIAVDAAFTRDGQRLVLPAPNGSVRFWDANTGQEVLQLPPGFGLVCSLDFSPDGHRLATVSHRWILFARKPGELRIWDATPLGPKYAKQRLAQALVDSLYSQWLVQSDVLKQLTGSKYLSNILRPLALKVAKMTAAADPGFLNNKSWDIVWQSGKSKAEYQKALGWAQASDVREPNNTATLNTLGVAYYRVGKYTAARQTLLKSVRLREQKHPTDFVFLAMSNWYLGEKEKARTYLQECRNLLQRNTITDPQDLAENQSFLREAERLIDEKSGKK